MQKRLLNRLMLPLVVLVAALGYLQLPGTPPQEGGRSGDAPVAAARLSQAYEARQSGVWVEVTGVVKKRLPDDNEGNRHQRFLIRTPGGPTVLVAHNIDLADPVPLERGDEVAIRGRYEWNDKGGVLHWTHHDPRGHIRGGWIRHGGETFE